MFCVAGLGNPGNQYSKTRHNIGFWVIAELINSLNITPKWQEKFGSQFCKCSIAGEDVFLVLPQLFMNRSGEALLPLVKYFKIDPKNLIVAYDDVDLKTGVLRLRKGGASGGHHGIEDITKVFGSPDFYRVRVGIDRPQGRGDVVNWVLGEPKGEELSAIMKGVEKGAKAIPHIIEKGLVAAQNISSGNGF